MLLQNIIFSFCFIDFIFKTCSTRYIHFIYSSDRQAMDARSSTANKCVDNPTPIKNKFVSRLNAVMPTRHHLSVDVLIILQIHESPWRTDHLESQLLNMFKQILFTKENLYPPRISPLSARLASPPPHQSLTKARKCQL